ncbi:MTH538 TIR-like domain [Flavobacterium sp. CF108]|uniref:TIR domain-containing protein n=1 Tax=Flavobacterium sp. CF108 TaxID=1882758 RepID=UPI000910E5D8|nr:TIR domain-containing protein [Flavobacterium sp. CF108]SHH92733.1 MTH538 TIR-like domain [Flavobacterium sp. CF108]
MANPRAFISFDFDNNEGQKKYFVGQSINSKTPFNIEDWSSKSSLPQNEWEKIIHEKINKCNMLIVLVGKSMFSATGVAKEIAFAKEHNVPVFGVYVDGANSSSTLPSGLTTGRVVAWEWEKIAFAIDQVMKEGKNQ